MVWLFEEVIYVFHAGDTIAFLLRVVIIKQLTELHELNGAIHRYFRLGEKLKIDVSRHNVQESERIFLMADGVTKRIGPNEISALADKHHDKAAVVREIVNQGSYKGSQDDITAMIIGVEFEL